MEWDERIEMLQSMVGTDDSTETLNAYLLAAGQLILNKAYPYYRDSNPADVPEKYRMLQVEIAAAMLNKRGAEFETRHIENGIHRNYSSGYVPEDMLRQVVANVGIPR